MLPKDNNVIDTNDGCRLQRCLANQFSPFKSIAKPIACITAGSKCHTALFPRAVGPFCREFNSWCGENRPLCGTFFVEVANRAFVFKLVLTP